MRNKKSLYIVLLFIVCISTNFLGKIIADSLSLPIWLDSAGTMMMAYLLGPVCGTILGMTGNVLCSIFLGSSIIYALTSAAIGVTVGICAKKGYLNNIFGALSTASLVTLFSVAVSAPIDLIAYNGKIGNIWGEGVRKVLLEAGTPNIISCIIGQAYVEFLDKIITILIVFFVIRIARRVRKYTVHRMYIRARQNAKNDRGKDTTVKLSSVVLAAVLAASLCPQTPANAQAPDEASIDSYIQTVYNNENGFSIGVANDICKTKDGVLWIGTYNGLYRYNGSTFQWMNELESVKTVNCLFVDQVGRMWIGTRHNGISICINQKIVNVINEEHGLSSNNVQCITEGTDGNYYVGTTGSLSILRLSSGLDVYDTIPEIVYAKSICSDKDGNIATVTEDGRLYFLNGTEIYVSMLCAGEGLSYTCCSFDKDGILYVGTSNDTIERFRVSGKTLVPLASVDCHSLGRINSINFQWDSAYICADKGIGRLDISVGASSANIISYSPVYTNNDFDQSIERMLVDYQGNLWFTSSRRGLLQLSPSVFKSIYDEGDLSENVVNSTTMWNGKLFIGTDSGLEVADEGVLTALESKLLVRLDGARIRCLFVDSKNSLWISTMGMGILECPENGEVKIYNSRIGTSGDKFRAMIELKDGTIAASGDGGITFIRDGAVVDTITSADGLKNPNVLAMYEAPNGELYAGTDGKGVAIIKDGKIVRELKKENGLSSEVILRIVEDADNNGIFYVTANSLCYQNKDGEIRSLDNFPYYNNYDLVESKDGALYVLGSAGIYVVSKEKLLSGNPVRYALLDFKKGLKISLTPGAWDYLDEEENLYLSGNTGVVRMNLKRYTIQVRSYRVVLPSIKIDGEIVPVERGEVIKIGRDAVRVEISPEVINYSVNDPNISVYLDGYDKAPKVMPLSEFKGQVYSRLPAGNYTFRIAILQRNTDDILAENTYRIVKEKEFYDNPWFMAYMVVVGAMFVAYITWMLFRTQVQKILRLQRREIEQTKKQIQMGNETIITIAKAVDAKDVNTSQHSSRVSEYSVMIARELGFSEEKCEKLRQTALLHDIGKIGIPDSILNKPARLTDEEYTIMKTHVTRGAEILKNFTLIDDVSDGALYHHERYDGNGYVFGLKGDEIPLNARIIGIADAFDAMTANRVYRKQLDIDFVIQELKRCRGTQFDPKLVDVLLRLIENGTIDVESLYNASVNKSGGDKPDAI